MDQTLKRRLVGASVLVALAVIFLPEILRPPAHRQAPEVSMEIPPRPQHSFDPREPVALLPPPAAAPVTAPDTQPPVPAGAPITEPAAPSDPADGAGQRDAGVDGGRGGGRPSRAQEVPDPDTGDGGSERDTVADASPRQDDQEPTAAAAAAAAGDGVPENLRGWVVQVGSFSAEENARRLVQRLRQAGYAAYREPVAVSERTLHRVRVGPHLEEADARAQRDAIRAQFELNAQLRRHR